MMLFPYKRRVVRLVKFDRTPIFVILFRPKSRVVRLVRVYKESIFVMRPRPKVRLVSPVACSSPVILLIIASDVCDEELSSVILAI